MVNGPTVSFGIQSIGDYSYSTKHLSLVFAAANLLYGLSGVVLLVASLIFTDFIQRNVVGSSSVAVTTLALKPVDLRFGIATGILIFVAIIFAIPGAITKSRGLLKTSSIFSVVSIVATLTLGLSVWFITLIEKAEFLVFWQRQSPASAGVIQDRFNCCGYFNSTSPSFVVSTACPTSAIAAIKQGCFLPFTSFADELLNHIFTTVFGLSGVAMVTLLTGLVLTKRISELERFRAIDIKKSAS